MDIFRIYYSHRNPFLVSSSLISVIAQRLVRKACIHCKQNIKVNDQEAKEIGLENINEYSKGKGCKHCFNTGYHGRIAIFELLEVTSTIHNAIVNKNSSAIIKKLATESGLVTLREDGLIKVKENITTPEEVLKATELPVEWM